MIEKTPTDEQREAAAEVNRLATELNGAINRAAREGVRVEVDVHGLHDMGSPPTCYIAVTPLLPL